MNEYIIAATSHGEFIRAALFVAENGEAALTNAKGAWRDLGRISWCVYPAADYPAWAAELRQIAHTVRPGDRVISIAGEWDDNDGERRETGPNATGVIQGFADDHYDVSFANGTHVRITPDEIADPTQYTILR